MAFIFASGLHHATECPSSGLHPRIEWSSSGPYFNGSFLVVDITFCSVIWTRNVQCVEQHTRQISLVYTAYLSVNGGDSVPKRCASAMLDEGHCSGLHQSTRCGSGTTRAHTRHFEIGVLSTYGMHCKHNY